MSNIIATTKAILTRLPVRTLSRITANEKQSLRTFRPIVYLLTISGGIDANVAAARRYCRFAVERYIPIAPHLLFPQFLDDKPLGRTGTGTVFGNALIEQMLRGLGIRKSHLVRMESEIKRAKWKNHCLRYFTEECQGGLTLCMKLKKNSESCRRHRNYDLYP